MVPNYQELQVEFDRLLASGAYDASDLDIVGQWPFVTPITEIEYSSDIFSASPVEYIEFDRLLSSGVQSPFVITITINIGGEGSDTYYDVYDDVYGGASAPSDTYDDTYDDVYGGVATTTDLYYEYYGEYYGVDPGAPTDTYGDVYGDNYGGSGGGGTPGAYTLAYTIAY